MYNELPWKWLWSLLVNTWPQTLFQPTRPVKGRHLLWIAPLNWQLLCLSVSRWPYLLAIYLVRHSYIAKMKKKVTWHHLKHSTRLFIIKFSKGLETFGFLILFSRYSCFANADTISLYFFLFFIFFIFFFSKSFAQQQFAKKYLFIFTFFVCHGAI